jgi:hypothetical protein
MDQPVDERTASDLKDIVESRRLNIAQAKVLTRNVTGALRPNRDFYLWVLVNVLQAAFLAGSKRERNFNHINCALEIAMADNAERRQVLTDYCAGHDGIRLTGEGLAVGDLKFAASWARIEHALAFGEFFIVGHDRALCNSFMAAVTTLGEAMAAAAGVEAAVSILSRRIGQWRRDNLPLGRYERQFSALIAFLNGRGPGGRGKGLTFDDDDIVAYWGKGVDGERLMFATAVERFRDFERYLTKQSAIRNLGMPADLDALVTRMNLDFETGESWHDTEDEQAEDRLVEALNCIPAEPKTLKGTERQLIECLVTLQPYPKQRPLTVLRLLAFGAVQSGIANRLRRGKGGADVEARVTCAEAENYDMIAVEFKGLLEHFESLLRIAAALRFDGEAPMQDVDPALAERVQRRADIIQQGNADLKRMRRAGFDQPREDLAAIFREFDGVISELRDVVRDFTKAVERLGEGEALCDRFAKDKPVFSEILTRAYTA